MLLTSSIYQTGSLCPTRVSVGEKEGRVDKREMAEVECRGLSNKVNGAQSQEERVV